MKRITDHLSLEPPAARELLVRRLELTPREADVLWLVIHGKTNDEISAVLRISTYTVKTHIEHLFERIGIHTRVGIAVIGALTLARRED